MVIVLVFTEEIAFKHFLFINITNYLLILTLQSPGSLYSLVITQTLKSEKRKYFKDSVVYLINVFRISHTLKRNTTKLVCVRKEKNRKLKILISSLFQRKNSNMVFPKLYVKRKTIILDFKQKRYSETLINDDEFLTLHELNISKNLGLGYCLE